MITAKQTSRAVIAMMLTAAAILSGPVHAQPMTLNFAGTVTQTSFDPFDPFGGAVMAGSPFHAYLNFDSSAVDTAASPNLGVYSLGGSAYGFAPIIGSIIFPVINSVSISIVDGVGGAPDLYSVFASEGVAGGLGDYLSLSILLQDDAGTAFSSDALPTGTPDLSRFAAFHGFVLSGQYTDTNNNFIQYEIQGQVVPEPATAGLVSLALLGCAATARGRRGLRRHALGS